MLDRLRRQLAFAREVPPRQIARRLGLMLRRRAERFLRPSLAAGPLRRRAGAPLPLFPPREGLAQATDTGWIFRFIGREAAIGRPIDWRAPGGQLWRMNLHYMEYLEEVSDGELESLVRGWISANPPYAPGAEADSWNAYALSLRIVVWMQQLARRPGLDPALVRQAELSLAGQVRYLERHLETDVGGNHLIKNVKALVWASAFFEGAAAERWRRKGLALLARELPRQMLPDGMHFELSPSYHCQVFADLLEVRHALGADPLGGLLDGALARAAQCAADLAHPDGGVAQFSDSGLSMAYAPAACLDVYERLFGRRPAPRGRFALGDAGYFGCREEDSFLIIDAGRIAPGWLPAHGHGDIGSFEWSLEGERIVVDQGVFEYVAGPRRDASRTAASHNTLWVEGSDQAEFFGAFRCGRRPRVRTSGWIEHADGFALEVRHDGFDRLSGGPVHVRRVEAAPRRIRIEDRLEGAAFGRARVSILLHPSARTEKIAAGQIYVTCGKARALVTGSSDMRTEPAVWWPDMGVEFSSVRLVMDLDPGVGSSWFELRGIAGRDEGAGA